MITVEKPVTDCKKPLPAKDAAALMPANRKNIEIDKINQRIQSAAANNKTEVRIDDLCHKSGHNCSLSPLGEEVVRKFLAVGYTTRSIYDCGQFVDIGMALSWKNKDHD